ncbi:hypothetical protein Tco_0775461 [Tanacetum coccineum]
MVCCKQPGIESHERWGFLVLALHHCWRIGWILGEGVCSLLAVYSPSLLEIGCYTLLDDALFMVPSITVDAG